MTSLGETAMDPRLAADDEATLDPAPVLGGLPLTEDPQPEPVPEPPAAIAAESMGARWHDIQATFVDDPRTSAEMAARLVDDSVQELVALVRKQQDSLQAAWHDLDTGTEELRTAVQRYRTFATRLADFCRDT